MLKSGYNPEDYMDWIRIDEEGHILYPEGAIIKAVRLNNCFEVLGHDKKGVHKVRSVGGYLGSRDPPSELRPNEIDGMADNKCRLVVYGEEVMFSDEFEAFKQLADSLLGSLPESDIAKFSDSDNFAIYEEVMEDGLALPYKKRKRFVQVVDDLLGKMPSDSLNKFVESEAFERYATVAEHYRVE